MAQAALDSFDAYVGRTKGPPGRAACRALADRLRLVEPALADARDRERQATAGAATARSYAEACGAEMARLRERLARLDAMQAERDATLCTLRDASKQAQRRIQELEGQALLADEQLRKRAAPPALASWVELVGTLALGLGGGWLAHR